MAKKNKHKATQHDLKIIAARHKNEYMGWIKYYMDLWMGEGTYKLLPEKNKEILYVCRFTTPRLLPAEGTRIKSKLLNEMKETILRLMEAAVLEIINKDMKIPFLHFTTYYMTIHHYITVLENDEFKQAEGMKERFKDIELNHGQIIDQANEKLASLLFSLATLFSSPEIKYYWIKTDNHLGIKDLTGNYLILYLHESNQVIHEFDIHNDRRPAYKIGIPLANYGIQWIRIKPPDSENIKWKKKYEVYIQKHAIDRLYERIDCIVAYQVMFELFLTLINPIIIYEKGRMLIAYCFGNNKMGYFVTDLLDGKLLIRTFLFITNDGTPEARKLKEIAGLGKLDVKYWNIDKLKTFIESDIAIHPEIKNIFIEAGCKDLFTLNLEGGQTYSGKIHVAQQMLTYLKKDSDYGDDDYDELETELNNTEEPGQLTSQDE